MRMEDIIVRIICIATISVIPIGLLGWLIHKLFFYPDEPNEYNNGVDLAFTPLTYDNFISFYNINPKRWEFWNPNTGWIKYYPDNEPYYAYINFMMKTNRDREKLKEKYKEFQEQQNNIKQAKDLSVLIAQSKLDIANYEKLCHDEYKEVYETILGRLQNEPNRSSSIK